MTDLNGLIAKVGGQRNATAIVAAGGAGLVWVIGRRKRAKSQQAQPVNVVAQGYADTAQDPTALYTGYDQLQQEIDALRGQQPTGQGSGVPNPNPVPLPVSTGSPTPVAPVPAPNQTALTIQKLEMGQPLAPAQLQNIRQTESVGAGAFGGPLTTAYGMENYGPGPGATGGGGYGPGPSNDGGDGIRSILRRG